MFKIEIDIDDEFVFGERRGSVFIGNQFIRTPVTSVTKSDLTRANRITSNFAIDIHFPNKVFENQDFLLGSHIEDRIINLEGRDKHSDTINQNVSFAKSYSQTRASYYVPIIDKNVRISRKLIEALVKMQLNTQLDFVTILDSLIIPTEEMKTIATYLTKNIIDNGKIPLYAIPMDTEENLFSLKIDIMGEVVSGIVGLYADYRLSYRNYDKFSEMRSKETLLRIISGVEKTYPNRKSSGGLYPLSFLASDFASPVFRRPPFGTQEKNKEKVKQTNTAEKAKKIANERRNARRYDHLTGGYLPIPLHKDIHGSSLASCNCPICTGSSIDDVAAEYEGSLADAFKIHDVFGVHTFVERSSGLFHNGKLLEDLKERRHVIPVLSETFDSQTLRNQTKLF